MSLPNLYRQIDRMSEEEPLQRDTSLDIVRKAQVGAGEFTQESINIWGTFSRRNGPNGYSLSYSSGQTRFPDVTTSMSRYGDLEDAEEARVLVNVVAAGVAGSTLSVEGDALPVPPEVSLASVGLFYSAWEPVISDGGALLEWYVNSPTSGTLSVGLCQLQVR